MYIAGTLASLDFGHNNLTLNEPSLPPPPSSFGLCCFSYVSSIESIRQETYITSIIMSTLQEPTVSFDNIGVRPSTNIIEVEDREGDAYYDDVETIPAEGLVAIVVVLGFVVTGLLLWFLVWYERRKRDKREVTKQQRAIEATVRGTSSASHSSGSTLSSPRGNGFMSTGAHEWMTDGE